MLTNKRNKKISMTIAIIGAVGITIGTLIDFDFNNENTEIQSDKEIHSLFYIEIT